MNELKKTGSFSKNYDFGVGPKRFQPDSEECPDLLQISVDKESGEISLLQNNSLLVDETIGCAESSSIYIFSINNDKLLLEKIDYAG